MKDNFYVFNYNTRLFKFKYSNVRRGSSILLMVFELKITITYPFCYLV